MKSRYLDFQNKIGITFTNQTLLDNVFFHRSYLNEHKDSNLVSNEKLEFLGDSVLSLITSIYLYKNFPQLDEGIYTDIKASIVRTESLAEIGKKIGLGELVYLSKGEELNDGRINKNILADCFESFIAAIFIDKGFDCAYNFILEWLFKDKLNYIISHKLYLSPKSRLQEIIQAKYKTLPVYKIIKEEGPEHKKAFTISVYYEETKLGSGSGSSKKEAEESAAKNALEKLT